MNHDASKELGVRVEARLRILEAARKLFSIRGFDGTSVREIARESEVNLSAINYHFKSKESLYWALMLEMHRNTHEHMRVLADQSAGIEDFALRVFDFFLQDLDFVRSIMKLMLSPMPARGDGQDAAQELGQQFGPPGAEFFGALIQKGLPYQLSPAGMRWGVDVIFNHITQTAMIFCSPFCSLVMEGQPAPTAAEQSQGLRWLIESTLDFMQKRPELFRIAG